MTDVDALAQEIRRVDGSNSLGAGQLAEALAPFINHTLAASEAARIKAEGEVERWQSNWDANVQEMSEKFRAVNIARVIEACGVDIFDVSARAQAAEAEVERLREVLEPFANEADQWEGYDDGECLVEGWESGPSSSITVGDLRHARAALRREPSTAPPPRRKEAGNERTCAG